MTRVLLASPSPVVRAGLAALLRSSPAIQVAGETAGLADLPALVQELQPDVVLADILAAEDDWLGAIQGLAPEGGPALVLLVGGGSAEATVEAFRAGVRAVLPRDLSAAEVVAAVEAAAAGLTVVHPQDLPGLLPSPTADDHTAPPAGGEVLSPREVEVLRMLAEGLGNKTIAWKLGISEHTVKFHVASIMTKLNAGSRTEAVTIGVRRGLILL